jgi:hypothetical protein
MLLNRSYILFALSGGEKIMTKMGQLSSLRKTFKGFTSELIEDGNVDKPSYLQHSPKIFFGGSVGAIGLFDQILDRRFLCRL